MKIETGGNMYPAAEQASGETWAGAIPGKSLGELLVERSDVQRADVEKALQIQKSVGGRLGPLLVRIGAISEDLLLQRLAEQQDASTSGTPKIFRTVWKYTSSCRSRRSSWSGSSTTKS